MRESSMATVLSGEDWTGYEGTMRQGLRELDDTAEMKRRGTYASKPLVSVEEDRGVGGRKLKGIGLSTCSVRAGFSFP